MGKILVTGGTGFVGKHLAERLESARYVVRQNYEDTFSDNFVVDRIDGQTDWSNAFDGIEVVIHLAAVAHSIDSAESKNYREVNVEGTLHLAEQAAKSGVGRIVFISSIGVNGISTYNEPFYSAQEANPHNAYSQSKHQAELGLIEIGKSQGIEVVIVRPTLVYGPNAPGNFGKLTRLISKSPLLPFGLAENRRDFIAVQNLVDLVLTCATHPNAKGHTFLASDGEAVSTKDFTNAIAFGLGKKVFQLPVPQSVMRLLGRIIGRENMIEQLFGNLQVDSSCIKKVLGWEAPLTMLQAMALLRHSKRVEHD